MVVTVPVEVTRRMEWINRSARYRVPVESDAIPEGLKNLAAAPTPSSLPLIPSVPASRLTTPPGVILRTVRLPVVVT